MKSALAILFCLTLAASAQMQTIVTNSVGGTVGGDSGSPTFICVSNRLVFLANSGPTSAGLGTNLAAFLADVNFVTTNAGFSTNEYPVEFETLSQFPTQ